ncbi:MAG TPA: AAA family ATPase [Spirochaetota bacterium]|nr:AAA family ATPase [Spirochaetota bacterium]HPQ55340.1 AAA family ATPase [Spirochaetota bacterium]
MKIAISGAHYTGKTTLGSQLSTLLTGYSFLEEPYYQLLEDGYEFCAIPGVEDYEVQLELSIQQITDSDEKTIFDRCPLDFLAYIKTHKNSNFFNIEDWKEKIDGALNQLDVVVYVPVESPDLIPCPLSEYPKLRDEVDIKVQDLIYDFESQFSFTAIEVRGKINNRLNQVLELVNVLQE